MPVVALKHLYLHALKHHYIVGAFNVFNYDTLCAVLEAARKEQSPVIIQLSMGSRSYVPDYQQFMKLIKLTADSYPVPVGINHDHCTTVQAAKEAVDAGAGGVMFDGSGLSFEENVKATREVADYAHEHGAAAEAELGCLPGFEDEIFAEHVEFTNPWAAARFVEQTGCDSLAVSVGTSHGGVKGEESLVLHYDILEAIHKELGEYPLVLHGAASLPVSLIDAVNEQGGMVPYMKNCDEDSICRTADYGVCKANMDVDNFLAFTGAVRRALNDSPDKYDPRLYLKQGKTAWEEEVRRKMRYVTKSSGKSCCYQEVRE